jgi:hypothetical protein
MHMYVSERTIDESRRARGRLGEATYSALLLHVRFHLGVSNAVLLCCVYM